LRALPANATVALDDGSLRLLAALDFPPLRLIAHALYVCLCAGLELLVWTFVGAALVVPGTARNPSEPSQEPVGPSDEELMVRYVGGDQRAFQTLMSRHQRRVFGYIYKFYYNQDKASEIFQESFYKVIRGAASFDPNQKFTSWMYTVVRNTVLDDFKKRKLKARSLNDPLMAGEPDRTLMDIVPDVHSEEGEKAARVNQLQIKLRDALAKMNADQREVFLMRHEEGLPFEEIATIMGCPVNTAKTRMRYALEALRKDLKEFL